MNDTENYGAQETKDASVSCNGKEILRLTAQNDKFFMKVLRLRKPFALYVGCGATEQNEILLSQYEIILTDYEIFC